MERHPSRNKSQAWPLVVRLAAWVHQMFLGFYPADFQAEFGLEMQAFFEDRCLEVHGRSKTGGIVSWLYASFLDGLSSAAREHRDRMGRVFQTRPGAAEALMMGLVFLAGTWAAAMLAFSSLAAAAAWVVLNAALAGRALLKSSHFENVPGMAAAANLALIAVLLALNGAGARLAMADTRLMSGLAGLVLAGLAWLHASLVWRLRGEALDHRLGEAK